MKRGSIISQYDTNKLLNSLLALDRRIVERSLRIYNVPKNERTRMRAQIRRVHKAVRAIDLNPRNLAARNSWR
jgi:hypothetical protein